MLVGEGHDWLEGEELAWNLLAGLNPEDVCLRAKAGYDKSSSKYGLPVFGVEAFISLKERRIWGDSPLADLLLDKLYYYTHLPILWYLIQSKDVPLSGKLLNPSHTSEGLIFGSGSHTLPLVQIAEKYGRDVMGFLERGRELGGELLAHGDASVRLFAFPRVPVVLLLWAHDEEFPARADLLFDSTCSLHLPTDILWSVAMASILVMGED